MTVLGHATDPFSCVDSVTSVTVSDRMLIITYFPHHNNCITDHPSVQLLRECYKRKTKCYVQSMTSCSFLATMQFTIWKIMYEVVT